MLNSNAKPFVSSQKQFEGDKLTIPLPEGLSETLDKLHHPKFQKPVLGDHLYPLVHQLQPDMAGKLTGMFLEKDVNQLLNWLSCPADLASAVDKAMSVICSVETNDSVVTTTTTISNNTAIKTDELSSSTVLISSTSNVTTTLDQKKMDTSIGLNNHSASLHLKYLHPSVTVRDLYSRFDCISNGASGKVSSIRMCRHFATDPSTSFQSAFVHFLNENDATCAFIELGVEFGIEEDDFVLETDLY